MESPPPSRARRDSVILYADVRLASGDHVPCRVRNLSATGGCIDNAADLTEGDAIQVTMGAVPTMAAEVIWAKPTLAGLRFARPIDLAAARRPRATAASTPSAGWIGNLASPYRRQG